MAELRTYMFLVSLLAVDVIGDRHTDYDEPEQGGRSFFFLGGLIRRIRSRWQNPNLPPSPYGGGPIFSGYFGCGYYNCRPPVAQYQVVQPLQAVQHIQTIPPSIVVQQAQMYQPNAPIQAVAIAQANPAPVYPVLPPPPPPPPPPPQPPQVQYPTQVAYGSPQPYQPYPVYPSAYAPTVPGQVYQNAGCAYPGYPCGRKS